MKLILVLDLPGVRNPKDGERLTAQFIETLVESPANADSIIHTITSLRPKKE